VKDFADENENHSKEEEDEKDDQFPCIARGDGAHSLYRSRDDVTCVCAHVINTAAVAVFLNRKQ